MVDGLTVLDVGHGNAALFRWRDRTILIDAGPDQSAMRHLVAQGIERIDCIIISHAHRDHVRGLLYILESQPNVSIGQIVVNPAQQLNTDIWLSLCTEFDRLDREKGTVVVTSVNRSNSPILIDHSAIEIQVLSPPPGRVLAEDEPNRWSAVLRVMLDGRPVALFAGDSDATSWTLIRQQEESTQAPILVYPHHGGVTSANSTSEFVRWLIQMVSPRVVIFSNGRYSHPNPRIEVVERLANGIAVACTQLSRSCARVEILGREELMESCGTYLGACCAGTMNFSLPLDENEFVSSSLQAHREFVDKLDGAGDTPMCRRPRLT